jgi:hypothetical protein
MNSEEAEGKEETNAEISLAKGTRWSWAELDWYAVKNKFGAMGITQW